MPAATCAALSSLCLPIRPVSLPSRCRPQRQLRHASRPCLNGQRRSVPHHRLSLTRHSRSLLTRHNRSLLAHRTAATCAAQAPSAQAPTISSLHKLTTTGPCTEDSTPQLPAGHAAPSPAQASPQRPPQCLVPRLLQPQTIPMPAPSSKRYLASACALLSLTFPAPPPHHGPAAPCLNDLRTAPTTSLETLPGL